jgi:hypothetical protein
VARTGRIGDGKINVNDIGRHVVEFDDHSKEEFDRVVTRYGPSRSAGLFTHKGEDPLLGDYLLQAPWYNETKKS